MRSLAKSPDTDAVYVMTGPLYEREVPPLPEADESHRVPSGYWKIVTTEKDGFIDERFITAARTIENKTGLNFFHAMPAAQQDKLETGPATLLPDLGCSP